MEQDQVDDDEFEDETDEEWAERMEIEEEIHPRCQCPYCHCRNHVESGCICSDCLSDCHQG